MSIVLNLAVKDRLRTVGSKLRVSNGIEAPL